MSGFSLISDELINRLIRLIDHKCDCDTSLEKETGDYPPETNEKNFYGEPVWANNICEYCLVKIELKKEGFACK